MPQLYIGFAKIARALRESGVDMRPNVEANLTNHGATDRPEAAQIAPPWFVRLSDLLGPVSGACPKVENKGN